MRNVRLGLLAALTLTVAALVSAAPTSRQATPPAEVETTCPAQLAAGQPLGLCPDGYAPCCGDGWCYPTSLCKIIECAS